MTKWKTKPASVLLHVTTEEGDATAIGLPDERQPDPPRPKLGDWLADGDYTIRTVAPTGAPGSDGFAPAYVLLWEVEFALAEAERAVVDARAAVERSRKRAS